MAKTHKINRTVDRPRRKAARGDALPVTDFTLPSQSEVNVPSESLCDYNLFFFGEKGAGKTSLAAQFPNSLVFMFERGRRNLPIRQVPRRRENGVLDPPLSWQPIDKPTTPFLPLLLAAVEDDSIQTVVIDTIDRMYDACFDYCCWEQGVAHPSAADEGHQIWNRIKQEFEGALGVVQDVGKQLVLISHAREKEILSRLGSSYNLICATCTPTAWKSAQTICDFVFYYGFYGSSRCLKVRGDDQIVCSNQVPGHFLDPQGRPVELLAMGQSAEEAFQYLQRGFHNELYDITHRPESTGPSKRKRRSHG